MRSSSLVAAVAAAVSLLVAAPAAAHVGLMPGELAPGTTMDAQLVLAHGCGPEGSIPTTDDEAFATQAVTLAVPDGLAVTPRESAGWSLTTEQDASGRTTSARWEAADEIGAPGAVRFALSVDASALDDEAEHWLPVVQDCVDGEQLRWTSAGVESGDDLPAMRLTVSSTAANAPEPTGPSPILIALLVATVALGAGAVTFVVSGRRG
jgi:uncharacterized protein YcnI